MSAETRQLDDLRQAAYGLGMGFAQAAQIEGDFDRKLALFDAFHRSFASVRLAIALAMRVRREAQLPPPAETERAEVERAEPLERPDYHERPERYDERDRDREAERASLPLLLRTLERVADDARTLTPQAAELPSLRELLDQVRTDPATPSPAPSSPVPSGALRARLSGGTAALTVRPRPGSGPPGLNGLLGTPAHRPTGPPRR
jgi:hypothetical protein